jgi:hypothetical protein
MNWGDLLYIRDLLPQNAPTAGQVQELVVFSYLYNHALSTVPCQQEITREHCLGLAFRLRQDTPSNSLVTMFEECAGELLPKTDFDWDQDVQAVHQERYDKEYAPDVWVPRREHSGQSGKIVRLSNAHGLCFMVQFPDGLHAWYEPQELNQKKGIR